MTTPVPSCPECQGVFLLGDPAGALTVQHVPNACSLGAAQDATQAADHERLADPYGPSEIDRPASAAEIILAPVLGLPAPTVVTVRRVTASGAVTERRPS